MRRHDIRQNDTPHRRDSALAASMTQLLRRRGPATLTIDDMHTIAAKHRGKCLSTHYVNANISPGEGMRARPSLAGDPEQCEAGDMVRTCSMEQQKPSLAEI